jgi:hypothetical protein
MVCVLTGPTGVSQQQAGRPPDKEVEAAWAFVFSDPPWTPPEKVKPLLTAVQDNQVRRLMEQRLEATHTELLSRWRECLAGRCGLDILLGCSRRVLRAESDLGGRAADRLEALRAHWERMRILERVERWRYEAGRLPVQDLCETRYARLEAEIRLTQGLPGHPDKERLTKLFAAWQEAAKTEVAERMKQFQEGFGTLDILLGASRRLLAAQLEARDLHADRIAALEAHAARLRQIEKINDARYQEHRIPVQDQAQPRFHRAEAEIWLARGKAGEMPDLAD